jgi:polyhydroxybutyrate depolymerase
VGVSPSIRFGMHRYCVRTIVGLLAIALCSLILGSCQAPAAGLSGTAAAKTPVATAPAAPVNSIIDRSIPTTGCGKPAPIAPGTSANETLISGDLVRVYRLYLPPDYRADQRQALVLNFHGHGSNAARQERYTGFSLLAAQQGFIVVYPQGIVGPDGETGWDSGALLDPRSNDVLFVSDLLNRLQAMLCINPQQIYATGFSNGGGMTARLACELSGRIAAFASVSGSYYPLPGGCHLVRPVPILEFHGTVDRVVPYMGRPWSGLMAVALWLRAWAARDQCTQGPTVFFARAGVTGEEWTRCAGSGTVVHYRIAGGGHTWPGARFNSHALYVGKTTHVISATPLIWQFFQAHPLPEVLTRRAM